MSNILSIHPSIYPSLVFTKVQRFGGNSRSLELQLLYIYSWHNHGTRLAIANPPSGNKPAGITHPSSIPLDRPLTKSAAAAYSCSCRQKQQTSHNNQLILISTRPPPPLPKFLKLLMDDWPYHRRRRRIKSTVPSHPYFDTSPTTFYHYWVLTRLGTTSSTKGMCRELSHSSFQFAGLILNRITLA